MIANVTVFANNSELVKKLDDMGFKPLFDGVHNWESWFISNFKDTSHRAYFYEPFLVGKVEDINFKMMGVPDFIIWFSETVKDDEERWDDVTKYLAYCLGGEGELPHTMMMNAKVFLGTHVVPPCILKSQETVQGEDGLVTVRDATKHYYAFKSKLYSEKDLAIFSVTKPFVDDPFTIVLQNFSTEGPTNFFADLFACEDWGTSFCDVSFLKQLWEELEIGGDFDVDGLLASRTRQFFPIEGTAKVEPVVLRKSIEDVEKYII